MQVSGARRKTPEQGLHTRADTRRRRTQQNATLEKIEFDESERNVYTTQPPKLDLILGHFFYSAMSKIYILNMYI